MFTRSRGRDQLPPGFLPSYIYQIERKSSFRRRLFQLSCILLLLLLSGSFLFFAYVFFFSAGSAAGSAAGAPSSALGGGAAPLSRSRPPLRPPLFPKFRHSPPSSSSASSPPSGSESKLGSESVHEEGEYAEWTDEALVGSARLAVVAAMRHAWSGYERFAWGFDELRPLSRKGQNFLGVGASVVDSLDTLFLMGLTEEYARAKAWMVDFDFGGVAGEASTFETTIRSLGGLLAAHALDGDPALLRKAEDLGERLMRAFPAGRSFPTPTVRLGGARSDPFSDPSSTSSAGRRSVSIAEVGTLQLEFFTLARLTGRPDFARRAALPILELDRQGKVDGLVPCMASEGATRVSSSHRVTMGALGDSYYEYLLKVWLLTGKRAERYRRMYAEAADGIERRMLRRTEASGLRVLVELANVAAGAREIRKMDHLACFAGGMFALGAIELEGRSGVGEEWSGRQWEAGVGVTRTCREMYRRMPSGVAPEVALFEEPEQRRRRLDELQRRGVDEGSPAAKEAAVRAELTAMPQARHYLLRPETVESYFVLYRLTKNPMYRQWGWEAFQAIERECKHSVGYSGIRDVTVRGSAKDDTQQSFWMAETLKYLFLLFSDDDVLPLDRWVFNTEAHPLPIWDSSEVSDEDVRKFTGEEA